MAGEKKDDKPKIPDYITDHKKHHTYATQFLDTVSDNHSNAYNAAIDKHLKEEKDGIKYVNFDKLDDGKVQQEFVKTMADFYITKARQQYKIDPKKDLNKVERELLLQAYAGMTEGLLKQQVAQYGKKFNHLRFQSLAQQLNQRLGQQVYAAAASHLDESQINEILKYTGLEGRVQNVTLEEAVQILSAHHQEGEISNSALKDLVAPYKIKKKEEKKAA